MFYSGMLGPAARSSPATGWERDMSQARELVEQLVAIDSVNPTLVAGGAGEAEIARFVAAWLEAHGLDVEVQDLGASRANVIGRARGSGGGRSLILNAHMDTVS